MQINKLNHCFSLINQRATTSISDFHIGIKAMRNIQSLEMSFSYSYINREYNYMYMYIISPNNSIPTNTPIYYMNTNVYRLANNINKKI